MSEVIPGSWLRWVKWFLTAFVVFVAIVGLGVIIRLDAAHSLMHFVFVPLLFALFYFAILVAMMAALSVAIAGGILLADYWREKLNG